MQDLSIGQPVYVKVVKTIIERRTVRPVNNVPLTWLYSFREISSLHRRVSQILEMPIFYFIISAPGSVQTIRK